MEWCVFRSNDWWEKDWHEKKNDFAKSWDVLSIRFQKSSKSSKSPFHHFSSCFISFLLMFYVDYSIAESCLIRVIQVIVGQKLGPLGPSLQETKLCSSTRAPPTILSWSEYSESVVLSALLKILWNTQIKQHETAWDMRSEPSEQIRELKCTFKIYQDISRYIKIYQDIIEVWNSIDFNCDNSTCDSVHDTQSLWPGTSSDPFAVQFLDVIVTSDEKRNDGTSSSWVQHCRSSTTLCIEKRC